MKTISFDQLLAYLNHEVDLAQREYEHNMNQASDAAPYCQGWRNAAIHIRDSIAKAQQGN